MPMLMNCPRCRFQMDVSGIQAGTPANCPNCGSGLRIPVTQQFKVPPRPPASPAGGIRAGARGAQRAGRTLPPPKSNKGLLIGVIIAAAAAVAVAAFLFLGSSPKARPASGGSTPQSGTDSNPPTTDKSTDPPPEKKSEPDRGPLPPSTGGEPKPDEGNVQTRKGPEPVTPDQEGTKPQSKARPKKHDPNTFEPGARTRVTKWPSELTAIPEDVKKKVDGWIDRQATGSLLENLAFAYWRVIDRTLDDDEKTARYCFTVLEKFSEKLGMQDDKGQFFKTDWQLFLNAEQRISMMKVFIDFGRHPEGKDAIDRTRPITEQRDLSKLDWDRIIQNLRQFSMGENGKYEYVQGEQSGGYNWFVKLEQLKPDCYPYLVKYIDPANVDWAKGACVCLRLLTDFSIAVPKNEDQVKEARKEWLKVLGLTESNIPK